MFARFCKIYTNSGISDLTSITSYRNAKTKNTDYAYQFNEFKKTLQVNNLGNWVDKSQYPIDFKNEQLQLQDWTKFFIFHIVNFDFLFVLLWDKV